MKNKMAIILSFCVLLTKNSFSQNDEKFYMVFSARGASVSPYVSYTGHAYVTWLHKSIKNDSVKRSKTLGFFPNHEASFVEKLTGTESIIKEGFDANACGVESDHIAIEVDKSTWQRTLNEMKISISADYVLLENNCVSFIHKVAEKANLKTPKLRDKLGLPITPKRYLNKLFEKNLKKAKKVELKDKK